MSRPDPVKQAWQAAAGEMPLPRLDEVRAQAGAFHRRIRLRNRIEYGACVLVVLFFGVAALALPSPAARIGSFLIVLGTLFVAWQLHRRASALAPPTEAALPLIAHQRAQLARQRDALASVGAWYLLPLVPGLLMFALARVIEGGEMSWFQIIWTGFVVLVFAGIWLLNRVAARMLQTEIDALDALEGEIE